MKNNQNIKFIIAIDAGGSKTLGRIVCIETEQQWQLQTGAASLSHDLLLSCKTIKKLSNALLIKAKGTIKDSVIVCGAAGAGCEKNQQYLHNFLESEYVFKLITSDAKTSLYGAGRGEPLLVVAIGTGSVAMRLEGNGHESIFGGWGFIAGDFGSGADIGRQLVAQLLIEIDKADDIQNALILKVLEKTGTERQAILDWLKRATATEFASLAPIVFGFQSSNKLALSIIKSAASAIEQLIQNSQPITAPLPVAIVGGLADKLRPHLSPSIQSVLVNAKGDALDGAVYLAEQLIKKELRNR